MIPLFLFHTAVALVWYALVGWLCLATYRRLRLKTLPWIAGTYAASLVAVPATDFLMLRTFPYGADARSIAFTSAGVVVLGMSTLQHLSRLFLAVLAFSEVAFLLSRAFPEYDGRLQRLLLTAHRRARAIGVITVSVTVAPPLLLLGFRLVYGAVLAQ